jgi:hypothetical protein
MGAVPSAAAASTMNHFLIGVLSLINQILAVLLIIGGTLSGITQPMSAYYSVPQPWSYLIGGLLGLIGGLIAAAVVCGTIAAIVTMARELSAIRAHMSIVPVITERRARDGY